MRSPGRSLLDATRVTGTVPGMRTHTRAAAVAAAATVVLSALSGCSSHHDPKPQAAPSLDDHASAPGPLPLTSTAPLTGLKTAKVPDRPALIVKVENSVSARPQTGLDKADIVTEELVEGGITRYAAMFQSKNPGVVGPVRSVRNVDADLTSPTRGLFAYSGGAGVVLKLMAAAPLQTMTESNPADAFFRSRSRVAPHNLYADAGKLWKHATPTHKAVPQSYLPFADDAASASTGESNPASSKVTKARLTFSYAEQPTWTYDNGTKRWLRSEGSVPAKLVNGARIATDNLLILRVTTRDAGYRDPAGNPVPATVLTGSGKLTVLSHGRKVTGTWHKTDRDSAFTFTIDDGTPLQLAPGRSFIELVPSSGSVKIS